MTAFHVFQIKLACKIFLCTHKQNVWTNHKNNTDLLVLWLIENHIYQSITPLMLNICCIYVHTYISIMCLSKIYIHTDIFMNTSAYTFIYVCASAFSNFAHCPILPNISRRWELEQCLLSNTWQAISRHPLEGAVFQSIFYISRDEKYST